MISPAPGEGRLPAETATGPGGDAPGDGMLALLTRMLDDLGAGVGLYERDGDDFRVVFMNRMARAIAGGAEVIGRTVREVYPTLHEQFLDALRTVEEEGRPVSVRALLTSRGRQWDAEVRPVGDGAGRARYVLAVGREVTAELRNARRLEVLVNAAASWSGPTTPEQVLGIAVREAMRLVPGIECAAAMAPAGRADVLEVVAAEGRTTAGLTGRRMDLAGSLSERAIREGRAVETARAADDSPVARALGDAALPTARVVPLRRGDEEGGGSVLAVLAFYRSDEPGFDEEERGVLDDFAAQAAVALHRAVLLRQTARTASRLRAGLEAGLDIGGSLDPRTIIERMLRRCLGAVDADRAVLMRIDGGEAVIEGAIDDEVDVPEIGTRMRVVLPEMRTLLEAGRPYVGTFSQSGLDDEQRRRLRGIRHSVTVPLLDASTVYAALSVSRRSEDPFVDEDVRTLVDIGSLAALALRNARLFLEVEEAHAQARATARRMAAGVEIALDISGETDVQRVVESVVRRAALAVDAARATIWRVDDEALTVEASYAEAGDALHAGSVVPLDEHPLIRRAVRAAGICRASRGDPDFSPAPRMEQMRHSVVLPLRVGGQPLGVLGLSRQEDRPFDDEEVSVLQQLAGVAALGLRSARLMTVRAQFMNMAAHELRTPLGVINGYLSMIRDGTFGELPEAMQRPMQILMDKYTELAGLVEELLIGSRLEGSGVVPRPIELDCAAAVEAAMQRAQPRVHLSGGTISCDVRGEAVALADPSHVARVLDNLINNAVQYSAPPGRIHIAVEGDAERIEIRVTDNGRGIPAALHDRVFEQFFRVEDHEFGYPSGTGLGLFISRGLARANGGDLRVVRSAPGAGTEMALLLPRLTAGSAHESIAGG